MRTPITRIAIAVTLFLIATPAAGIVIDGGPTDTPPGAGAEFVSGSAYTAGGATISFTGIDLTQTENLYFGVESDPDFLNGYAMDNGVAGSEIFTYDSKTATTIRFIGSTTMETGHPNDSPPCSGNFFIPTRITWTFSGTGSIVEDATTQALNGPSGDVQALWDVQSSDFSVNVLVEAQAPVCDIVNPFGWEPANDLYDRLDGNGLLTFCTTCAITTYDWGFYFEANIPQIPALGSWWRGVLFLSLVAVTAVRARAGRRVQTRGVPRQLS